MIGSEASRRTSRILNIRVATSSRRVQRILAAVPTVDVGVGNEPFPNVVVLDMKGEDSSLFK